MILPRDWGTSVVQRLRTRGWNVSTRQDPLDPDSIAVTTNAPENLVRLFMGQVELERTYGGGWTKRKGGIL